MKKNYIKMAIALSVLTLTSTAFYMDINDDLDRIMNLPSGTNAEADKSGVGGAFATYDGRLIPFGRLWSISS